MVILNRGLVLNLRLGQTVDGELVRIDSDAVGLFQSGEVGQMRPESLLAFRRLWNSDAL
ncbi:MAG: hypothetical protein V2I43_26470 [Parvularcula sp.]|nr:hypothetical protein [Parvularcula sp.]